MEISNAFGGFALSDQGNIDISMQLPTLSMYVYGCKPTRGRAIEKGYIILTWSLDSALDDRRQADIIYRVQN